MEILENKVVDELVVDDGTRKIPIKNYVGEEVGVFYFSPTDMGILTRFKEVSEKFATVTEPLKNVSINANGEADDEESEAALAEAEKRLYDLCDYLFGGNLSRAFFGKVRPFSPIDGKFYCENALNVVSRYVSKQFNAEVEKINSRVDKYTHGVRSGKHKDGRK